MNINYDRLFLFSNSFFSFTDILATALLIDFLPNVICFGTYFEDSCYMSHKQIDRQNCFYFNLFIRKNILGL